MTQESDVFDCIIIGKGPAGISAGIYIKRSNFSVLVLGKDAGALGLATKLENYYGTGEAVSGKELFNRGIKQAESFGISVLSEEVIKIEPAYSEVPKFSVVTSNGKTYTSKTVLLATGKKSEALNVPGFNEYRGKGISFCAVCDGFFYKNKKIAVVGSGEYALAETLHLANISKEIFLLTNGKPLDFDSSRLPDFVKVIPHKIKSFFGDESHLHGLSFFEADVIGTENPSNKETNELSVEGVFVAVGSAGANEFAATIGLKTITDPVNPTKTVLAVSDSYETSVKGLYAAGDVLGGFSQVAKAVADGAIAGTAITKALGMFKN